MTDTPLCNQCFEEAQDFHKSALVVPLDFARQLERELNAAKAELADLKKVIRKIYYDTETYADGAPDATDHDKLCNEISSQLEPFIR